RDRDHIMRTEVLACCQHAKAPELSGKVRGGTELRHASGANREMRHVEKQLGYHHAGVVVWNRRGHARPIFTGSSARRRTSSRRMRRAPYGVWVRLSQLQGMASRRAP